MKPVIIMDVPVHPVTNDEIIDRLKDMMEEPKIHSIMTPNPEMVMLANKHPELMMALTNADLVLPDGIGLIIASKMKKIGLKERVTGIDTMAKVLQICHENHMRIFLLGGKPGRAEKAISNMLEKYSGIEAAGCHHGYYNDDENDKVVSLINEYQPHVLFVCLGSPRQEVWIHKNSDQLNCRITMGVGGSVDVYAGEVKRAPAIYQQLGIEWFYRLIQEPTRIRRMSVLPLFLWRSLWMPKRVYRKER